MYVHIHSTYNKWYIKQCASTRRRHIKQTLLHHEVYRIYPQSISWRIKFIYAMVGAYIAYAPPISALSQLVLSNLLKQFQDLSIEITSVSPFGWVTWIFVNKKDLIVSWCDKCPFNGQVLQHLRSFNAEKRLYSLPFSPHLKLLS